MTRLGDEILSGFRDWFKVVVVSDLRPDSVGHVPCGWVGPALTPDGRCPNCGEVCPCVRVRGKESEDRP